MKKTLLSVQKEYIYIPLCLYFNDGTEEVMVRALLFTFHYVSILIKVHRIILFQFIVDLHSIMSLF